MEETPTGTPVGVDDPYEHVDRCDHLTDDGRCRFAFERFEADPAFARERRDEGYRCPVVDGEWEWADCPNVRSTTDGNACRRCGLEERRVAFSDERPLIEEHHLSYADAATASDEGALGGDGSRDGARPGAGRGGLDGSAGHDEGDDPDPASSDSSGRGGGEPATTAHEITVALCRWCHANVHDSWARVDDDASPPPEALAALEERRSREQTTGFEPAADRYDLDDSE